MAHRKQAHLQWTGENFDFKTTLGSGYELMMNAPEAGMGGGGPMELLLAGVAGCTGVDILSILQKMRQEVLDLQVEIDGERAEDYPMVYTDVTIVYRLKGKGLEATAVEKAIELSMTKYCSASIIFKRAGVHVATEYSIEEVG
jgi:putative redox protein